MNQDPIVEEVHRTRQKLLSGCNGDLDKLLDRLKTAEVQDRGRALSPTSPAKEACDMQSQEADVPLPDSPCG